jgi:hypothetical protein
LQELAQQDNRDDRNRALVIENGNAELFVNMMPGQRHFLQPMNFDRDQHDRWDEDQIQELLDRLDRLENKAIEEPRHMNLHYRRYPYEYPA